MFFGAVIIVCIAAGTLLSRFYHSVSEKSKVSAAGANGFYVQCNPQFGPTKIPAEGLFFAMINETGADGLSHLPITDPSQEGQEYKILNDRMIEVMQCKLSNYEQLPALDVVLDLKVLFRKVNRYGIVVEPGEIVGQRIVSLKIGQMVGKIDPGAGNSFTFYIANRSQENGISIIFSNTIPARLLNEEKVRSFRVAAGGLGAFLLPERPFPPKLN